MVYTFNPHLFEPDDVTILKSGNWWVAELNDESLAAQGESKQEALDKLERRVKQYKKRRFPDSNYIDYSSTNDVHGIDE